MLFIPDCCSKLAENTTDHLGRWNAGDRQSVQDAEVLDVDIIVRVLSD